MSKPAVDSQDQRSFFKDLSAAKSRVLLIDYDGTVAPFSPDRHRARPYPAVLPLLQQIMTDCATRLIIVSGRSASDVPRLLGMHPTPEIWGSHGVERVYPDGRYEELHVTDEAVESLAEAEICLDEQGLGPYIEVKIAGVAVHWRGQATADVVKIRSSVYRTLEPMTSRGDLVIAEFDEGVELRLRSANKGDAVRGLLKELGANVSVAYLGDDVDDEDAFRALNGSGLTVLVKPQNRFSAAQIILRPPDELLGFLEDWVRACNTKA